MNATDQLRAALRDLEARARERELDKKIESFAEQADQFLRTAAARAGDFAAENRERIDARLAQAGASVDSRTEGKYHSYVDKVRAGVLSGVDWVAEQRESAASPGPRPDSSESHESSASAASSGPDTSSAWTSDAAAQPEDRPER
jgi:ElaB/YqjD/DUF883 family membrane-anchored ribosome-binding protein